MHGNAARWKVLSALRKRLRCWGVGRERCEEGRYFSGVGECVKMVMLVAKALTVDGLEVVRSKP